MCGGACVRAGGPLLSLSHHAFIISSFCKSLRYWAAGCATPFPALVKEVTGAGLSADAWVAELNRPLEAVLAEEKVDYEAGVAAGPRVAPGAPVDLGMRVQLVHGDELIADSATDGGFVGADAKFKAWLAEVGGGRGKAAVASG